jgi:hypothetical protein
VSFHKASEVGQIVAIGAVIPARLIVDTQSALDRVMLALDPTRVSHLNQGGGLSLADALLSLQMAQWSGVTAVGADSKSSMTKKARV